MRIKIKHRVSLMVLVVAMMIVAFTMCVSAADSSFGMSVEVKNSAGTPVTGMIKAGEEITVDVKIDSNPGIISLEFNLKYNTQLFKLEGVGQADNYGVSDVTPEYCAVTATTNIGREFTTMGDGVIKCSLWKKNAFKTQITTKGTYVTFKFKVLDAQEGSDAKFELDVHESGVLADLNGTEYTLTFKDAVIKVHNKHTEVEIPAVPATCTTAGTTKGSQCSVCKEFIVKPTDVPALGHNYKTTPGKSPTCTEDGYTDETLCTVCGDVKLQKTVRPKTGHNAVTVPGTPSTCTVAGVSNSTICSTCSTVILPATPQPLASHSLVSIPAVPSTCTVAGLLEGQKCMTCSTIIVEQAAAPLLAHTIVVDAAVEATYKSTGLTEGQHCSVCGTKLVEQTIIPKLAFPWVWVIVGIAVVVVAVVVVVYFVVIKKKNYKDDMFDDEDDE